MTDGPQVKRLKERLYGDDGMGVSDIKISRGPKFHMSAPEDIAGQINGSLDEIENGTAEFVEIDD